MNREYLAGIAAQVAQVEFSRRRDVIETEIKTPLDRKLDGHFLLSPPSKGHVAIPLVKGFAPLRISRRSRLKVSS